MNDQTIFIQGVRYYADRPIICILCRFWSKRKRACTLGAANCYYLAEAVKEPITKCNQCPYLVGRPCVTLSCYKDLAARMEELSNVHRRK